MLAIAVSMHISADWFVSVNSEYTDEMALSVNSLSISKLGLDATKPVCRGFRQSEF